MITIGVIFILGIRELLYRSLNGHNDATPQRNVTSGQKTHTLLSDLRSSKAPYGMVEMSLPWRILKGESRRIILAFVESRSGEFSFAKACHAQLGAFNKTEVCDSSCCLQASRITEAAILENVWTRMMTRDSFKTLP